MEVSHVLDLALIFVVFANLIVCPYTKVEESFNIQAIHDILYHGSNISQYDHKEFPGVVPRTFIGPLVISILSWPFVCITTLAGFPKIVSQYIVRLILGICLLVAFKIFRCGVAKKFGPTVGNFLAIITMTQFHFLFYLSRPLPNIFALILVLLSFSFWLNGNQAAFIWSSAYSIIIFRGELAMLMGIILLYELYHERVSLLTTFVHSVIAGFTSLVLTLVIDSYFWDQFCWPEGQVLWYNIVLNKSSNWGTLPFFWYFYSALPRSLALFTPVLIFYGLKFDRRTRAMFVIPILFVFFFSFLPHKELRFIFYVIPLMNAVAAVGLNYIYQHFYKWKPEIQWLYSVLVFGGLLSNFVFSNLLLYASSLNYPGGMAFAKLHENLKHSDIPVNVHICNLAAQTGISRFLEQQPGWNYNKTEHLEGTKDLFSFTHLVVEAPCTNTTFADTHNILLRIHGFRRISPKFSNEFPYFSLAQLIPRLCILEKKNFESDLGLKISDADLERD